MIRLACIDISVALAQHDRVQNAPGKPNLSIAGGGPPDLARPQWYCIKAKPKHEHIAAAHIQRCPEVEVFLPRIQFERPFKGTRIWVTEPLFPGYLFARFLLEKSLTPIRYAAGVQTVVHFGQHIPVLDEATLAELQAEVGPQSVRVVSPELAPGDRVQVVTGAFTGWHALVTRVLPARQRVAILMDFLGRQLTVEVPCDTVLKAVPPRHIVAARRPV